MDRTCLKYHLPIYIGDGTKTILSIKWRPTSALMRAVRVMCPAFSALNTDLCSSLVSNTTHWFSLPSTTASFSKNVVQMSANDMRCLKVESNGLTRCVVDLDLTKTLAVKNSPINLEGLDSFRRIWLPTVLKWFYTIWNSLRKDVSDLVSVFSPSLLVLNIYQNDKPQLPHQGAPQETVVRVHSSYLPKDSSLSYETASQEWRSQEGQILLHIQQSKDLSYASLQFSAVSMVLFQKCDRQHAYL